MKNAQNTTQFVTAVAMVPRPNLQTLEFADMVDDETKQTLASVHDVVKHAIKDLQNADVTLSGYVQPITTAMRTEAANTKRKAIAQLQHALVMLEQAAADGCNDGP